MSVRDSNVLHAVEVLGEIPLITLAQGLVDAIEEAEVEGVLDPGRDPAVMAFGAFIAFGTHCDVASPSDFRAALALCAIRFQTSSGAIQ